MAYRESIGTSCLRYHTNELICVSIQTSVFISSCRIFLDLAEVGQLVVFPFQVPAFLVALVFTLAACFLMRKFKSLPSPEQGTKGISRVTQRCSQFLDHHLPTICPTVWHVSPQAASETIPKKKQLVSNCWNIGMKYSKIFCYKAENKPTGGQHGQHVGRPSGAIGMSFENRSFQLRDLRDPLGPCHGKKSSCSIHRGLLPKAVYWKVSTTPNAGLSENRVYSQL